MSVTLAGYTHTHITEREIAHMSPCGYDDGAYEDCTPDASIMAWRAMGHPAVPATHGEAEQLRCASGRGPTGGTNMGDMATGIRNRYGGTIHVLGFGGVSTGWAWAVQGSMAAVPAHLRRWQPGFAGGHCVFVASVPGTDALWWDDPLAPEGTGYDGEWVTFADVQRFADGLPGARAFGGPIVADPASQAHELFIATGTRTLLAATLVPGGRISGWTSVAWSGRASSAGCLAPVYRLGTIRGGATTAQITRGKLAGRHIRVSPAAGTTVR